MMSQSIPGSVEGGNARLRNRAYWALAFLAGAACGGLGASLGIRSLVFRYCCTNGSYSPGFYGLLDDLGLYYVVFGGASVLLLVGLLCAWGVDRFLRQGSDSQP